MLPCMHCFGLPCQPANALIPGVYMLTRCPCRPPAPQATALRLLRKEKGQSTRFGGLLRLVGDQILKSCDPEEGG